MENATENAGTDRLIASRTVDAPVERVFALLADPDTHRKFDSSGTVRGSQTHTVLTEVGDVFRMDMHAEVVGGDYQTDNVVTAYRRDAEIAWAPGAAGREPFGHTYAYELRPDGDDRTVVTLTYDWSGVTSPRVRSLCPFVSAVQLRESLDLLAGAL
ncbi:MAG TPA: SRPBCC family protein [Pseudonocardia sp.]|jgi:uncharacterized protein YndB with AHSA1/START domain